MQQGCEILQVLWNLRGWNLNVQSFNLIFDIFGIIFCTDWYNWMFFSKNKQREFDFSVHIATLALRPQAWPHCETGAWRFSPPQTWGRDLRLVETSMLHLWQPNGLRWFSVTNFDWMIPISRSKTWWKLQRKLPVRIHLQIPSGKRLHNELENQHAING